MSIIARASNMLCFSGIAHFVLSHKPVNSLNTEYLTNISDTLKNLEKDDSVRGVVISSKFHGKVFSAGLHIPDLYNRFVHILAGAKN